MAYNSSIVLVSLLFLNENVMLLSTSYQVIKLPGDQILLGYQPYYIGLVA